jgi:hypothetical protein
MMNEALFTSPLSASLLGSLDLADDAVFDWLDAFAIDIGMWATLAHQAEDAGTAVALSFRHQAPMLWRDMPDGEYGVIARYNHGGAHYAIPRTARPPEIASPPYHVPRNAVCQARSVPTSSGHQTWRHTP